jgi:hypothetical protein
LSSALSLDLLPAQAAARPFIIKRRHRVEQSTTVIVA